MEAAVRKMTGDTSGIVPMRPEDVKDMSITCECVVCMPVQVHLAATHMQPVPAAKIASWMRKVSHEAVLARQVRGELHQPVPEASQSQLKRRCLLAHSKGAEHECC